MKKLETFLRLNKRDNIEYVFADLGKNLTTIGDTVVMSDPNRTYGNYPPSFKQYDKELRRPDWKVKEIRYIGKEAFVDIEYAGKEKELLERNVVLKNIRPQDLVKSTLIE